MEGCKRQRTHEWVALGRVYDDTMEELCHLREQIARLQGVWLERCAGCAHSVVMQRGHEHQCTCHKCKRVYCPDECLVAHELYDVLCDACYDDAEEDEQACSSTTSAD